MHLYIRAAYRKINQLKKEKKRKTQGGYFDGSQENRLIRISRKAACLYHFEVKRKRSEKIAKVLHSR